MSSKHDSIREVLTRLKSIERELTTVKDLIVRSVSLVPPPPVVRHEARPAYFDFGASAAPCDPLPLFGAAAPLHQSLPAPLSAEIDHYDGGGRWSRGTVVKIVPNPSEPDAGGAGGDQAAVAEARADV